MAVNLKSVVKHLKYKVIKVGCEKNTFLRFLDGKDKMNLFWRFLITNVKCSLCSAKII